MDSENRIAELEAKCYFEFGLSEEDSKELDNLIEGRKQNARISYQGNRESERNT